MVEVDGGVFAPEAELQVLAGDDFAGVLQEGRQDFEWLALDLDAFACLPEFAGLEVSFEETEGNSGWPLRELRHELFTSRKSRRDNFVF